jgi:hypothetical protein
VFIVKVMRDTGECDAFKPRAKATINQKDGFGPGPRTNTILIVDSRCPSVKQNLFDLTTGATALQHEHLTFCVGGQMKQNLLRGRPMGVQNQN